MCRARRISILVLSPGRCSSYFFSSPSSRELVSGQGASWFVLNRGICHFASFFFFASFQPLIPPVQHATQFSTCVSFEKNREDTSTFLFGLPDQVTFNALSSIGCWMCCHFYLYPRGIHGNGAYVLAANHGRPTARTLKTTPGPQLDGRHRSNTLRPLPTSENGQRMLCLKVGAELDVFFSPHPSDPDGLGSFCRHHINHSPGVRNLGLFEMRKNIYNPRQIRTIFSFS